MFSTLLLSPPPIHDELLNLGENRTVVPVCFSCSVCLSSSKNMIAPEPVTGVCNPRPKVDHYLVGRNFAKMLDRYSLSHLVNMCVLLRNCQRETFPPKWIFVYCLLFVTNIVEDLFVGQFCMPMDSIKQLTIVLEAVATCLDVLEKLSRDLALLSSTSDQQPVQNYSISAANIVDIIPFQHPDSYVQYLKLSLTITCKRTIRHVNCKRCFSARHKDTCTEVHFLIFGSIAFLT